jgi:hypothetical protein
MKEASCYRKLQKYQGTIIPVCLGSYTLSFRDRELEEDRTVHVLLCLYFHGARLDNISSNQLSEMRIRLIRAQVLGIQSTLLNEGILWPTIGGRNFVMLEGDGRIMASNFSTTSNLDSMDEKYREEDIEFQKEFLLDWLNEAFPLPGSVVSMSQMDPPS